MPEQVPGFYITPFIFDGELEGIGYWEMAILSAKWLGICRENLELHGPSFDAPWSGNLSHIQMKFTSAAGAALVTFSAHGKPESSLLLASGASPATDADVMKMFVDSLRRVAIVTEAAASPAPFQKVLSIKERPLMIVVPWADPTTSEQDHSLIRELALHTAGAYFGRDP